MNKANPVLFFAIKRAVTHPYLIKDSTAWSPELSADTVYTGAEVVKQLKQYPFIDTGMMVVAVELEEVRTTKWFEL